MMEINAHISSDQTAQTINTRVDSLNRVKLPAQLVQYKDINLQAHGDHRVEIPFNQMARIIDVLQTAKNKHYDNSYSKRGLFSIFFNVERKYERLVSMLFSNSELSASDSETLLDTVVDLGAYIVKMAGWICARRPDLFAKLLDSVQREAVSAGLATPSYQPHNEVSFYEEIDKDEEKS